MKRIAIRTITSTILSTLLWATIILFGLYLTSFYSYLLFHSLAELSSIIIAISVFLLVWYARRFIQNDYLLFIGIASLFISGLDTIHTLAYRGMGVFQEYDANLPTQLWIAARYLQSLSLLIAPVFFCRRLNPIIAFTGFAVIATFLLASIFFWDIFPTCYVEGVGLTQFKIISEYIISLILLTSIILLYQNRMKFDPTIFQLLIISIVATIGAELAFTFYVGVYDLSNFIGHLFKVISFFILARALVIIALEQPYNLLFRDLKQNRDELQVAEAEMRKIAMIDFLTGAYNRRAFIEMGKIECERARRYGHSLAVLIVDVDHFKEFNDKHGHLCGDIMLQKVVTILLENLRAVDILARWGGDEFAIFLPETSHTGCLNVTEKLRNAISGLSVPFDEKYIQITISVGCTIWTQDDESLDTVFLRADNALYQAKQRGRNCVLLI
jgi:diguanylate cyclase (GGDEF)-like protein